MFEKEEKQLRDWKEQYEQIDLPLDKLDNAIQLGFERTKPVKRVKKRRWIWASVAVATFFLTFIVSIRLSPVFAGYVSKIPGLDKLVQLIQYDKGLQDAMESEYAQYVGVSQEKNGKTLAIDSAVVTDQGMILFYTMESKEAMTQPALKAGSIRAADEEAMSLGSIHFRSEEKESAMKYTGHIQVHFREPLKTEHLTLSLEVDFGNAKESFSLPFTIQKQESVSYVYDLYETVEIEGQKITVKTVTVDPLRTAIHLVTDPTNTKKLSAFEDIQLVDEDGEVWSTKVNSVGGTSWGETERIIYMESNYFRKPKELYLTFNKIQAVEKDRAYILVDTETREILHQPPGEKVVGLEVEGSAVYLVLDADESFDYYPMNEVIDATGKRLELFYTSKGSAGVNEPQKVGFELKSTTYNNPLRMEISAYPTWIEGKAKIRVK